MALLRKVHRATPFRPRVTAPLRVGRFVSGGVSSRRPQRITKASPCSTVCLAGTDVRGVISLLAQRKKLDLSDEEACDRAWQLIVNTNPFPAITGRICPHRCEEGCNRQPKDGSVSVGAIERFLGDWGLERGLGLPDCRAKPIYPEKIAIIGAGPAGLSCAYQLVRRGYTATIFEGMPEPGGMFRYGIPPYRLPAQVVQGEIRRILDLGVELRTNTRIGRDVSLEELRRDFAAVFVAPGAGASRQSMPGVEGAGVYQGVDFLRDIARGQIPELGRNIVVVGGGNTAIDVARVCARLFEGKAAITLLRRRNPSVGEELREAMEERIRVELRGTINSVVRDAAGKIESVVAEYLDLDAKDSEGRPTLLPVPGSSFKLPADAIIVALGQKPNVGSLVKGDAACLEADATGKTQLPGVWRGGDAVTPTLAAVVITHGREVALAIDAELRGKRPTEPVKMPELPRYRIKLDWYEPRERLKRQLAPVADRLADLRTEVELGHRQDAILAEANRCLSCGSCFGCENCWMYCTPGCMKRLPDASPGQYFSIKMQTCDGCRKCADECPSGVLDMV
jgi:NADPH-dependent glutamate synthase beta subunit-like oxidoreductase/Pyruvate/2-oxoacid:ferredoxin oxidoreductase delta subunit